MVRSNFPIGYSGKQEGQWVSEADDRTAVRGHQGQEILNRRVHAAVHMDTSKEKKVKYGERGILWNVDMIPYGHFRLLE